MMPVWSLVQTFLIRKAPFPDFPARWHRSGFVACQLRRLRWVSVSPDQPMRLLVGNVWVLAMRCRPQRTSAGCTRGATGLVDVLDLKLCRDWLTWSVCIDGSGFLPGVLAWVIGLCLRFGLVAWVVDQDHRTG
jgi:hypothetical protein